MNYLFASVNAKPSISWLAELKAKNLEQHLIFDFFLNHDLHITSDPVIDPHIFLHEDYIFDSPILVQIDEIVDISLSSIKRKDFILNNSEKRITLKLLLSDGHYQFAAISKNYLPEFGPRIIPGVKIKIMNDTKMKFGILFLEKDKIEIVGGQSLELLSKRHSVVLYDEHKYIDQQNEAINNIYESQEAQPNTKKRKNASLVIIEENENKDNSQQYSNLKTRKSKRKQKDDNDSNRNKSKQNVSQNTFLDDTLFNNSNIIIDKVENETLQKNLDSPDRILFDPISNSSYSSDVEIINSIIQKQDMESLSQNHPIPLKELPKRKFLSDDDDFDDDFDFGCIQNTNNNKIIGINKNENMSTEKELHDTQKMKTLTMNDLLKRDNILKNAPEIFLFDGNIVECSDLKIILKKGSNSEANNKDNNLFFSMDCKIACGEGTMAMKVASKIISNLLDATPEDWINLSEPEQNKRYENSSKKLLSFKSPLFILSTGELEIETINRFFIITNDFIDLIT